MASEGIPDSVYKKLVCSHCSCYLSVGPIQVKPDGKSVCGRCVDEVEQLLPHQAFEDLVEHIYFPCRYQTSGCDDSFLYGKIHENHENLCFFKSQSCPNNEFDGCDWIGSAKDMLQHIDQVHPALLHKDPFIHIDVTVSVNEYRFISFTNPDALIIFKCYEEDSQLIFKCEPVCGIGKENFRITLQKSRREEPFDVSSYLDIGTIITRGMNESCAFDKDVLLKILGEPNAIFCQVTLVEAISFPTRCKIEEDEKITCSNCKVVLVPPIYKCPSDHNLCEDCTGYNNDICKPCDKKDVVFTEEVVLVEKFLSLGYVCRWPDCNEEFSAEDVRQHEQSCVKRTYTCFFLSCKWSGLLGDFISHMHENHSQTNLEVNPKWVIPGEIKAYTSRLLINNNEMFDCRILTCSESGRALFVNYSGLPRMKNNFTYKALIVCKTDPESEFNKTYDLEKTRALELFCEYQAKIPQEDLAAFDGDDKYEINILIENMDS